MPPKPVAVALGVALGLVLGEAVPARAERPLSVPEALLRAKPAVALIVAEVSAEVRLNCGSGETTATPPVFRETGTGWFIDPSGLVVTNAHVVQPAHTPGRWMINSFARRAAETTCLPALLKRAGLKPAQRPEVEEQLKRQVHDSVVPNAKVKLTPQISVLLSNGTRLPAEVKKYTPPLSLEPGQVSGRDLALLKVAGRDYPVLPVADSKVVKIGDPIHILGFPGVVLSHELLNQSASMEASVTNGAVSGFKEDVSNQPMIQTDAPAAWGNSGGPAVNSRGEVVGVLTFVSLAPGPEGSIVQGFNFVIPSDAVRQFIKGTEVTPGAQSRFNTVWWAGLRDFFNDRFTRADRQFEQADKIVSNLPDVKRMRAEADDKIKNPPPQPFPWAWVALGVTLVSASGYGGIWARRWWRNRFRIVPAQVIGLMESGQNPIFLDVRTSNDFETSPLKLPGAIRLAPEDIEGGRFELQVEPRQPIITYCASRDEQTSSRVTQQLRQRGHRNVRILRGGLGGWTNAGLPVEAKSHLPSIGLEIYKNLTVGDLPRRQFEPGQIIFKEGDDARGEAFVVHSGKVDIRKRTDGSERVIRTLGEGELLGEMALFRKAPRSASAVAATDVQLLVIRTDQLDWLIRNRAQLTFEILKRLSDLLAQREPSEEPGA
ncbi:MAG: trypsin-like peptidase domain-containing protein [Candidatus Rokubacteria bacterium]|nr:trypsin-like peptidase domain-containing protein [Candidatus Rokubacteria bacterium]